VSETGAKRYFTERGKAPGFQEAYAAAREAIRSEHLNDHGNERLQKALAEETVEAMRARYREMGHDE
jgi:hypothetical protein